MIGESKTELGSEEGLGRVGMLRGTGEPGMCGSGQN